MSRALSLPAIDAKNIHVLNRLFRISHQIFSMGFLPAQFIPSFSPLANQEIKTRLELRWDNLPIYLYLETSINELAASLLPNNIDLSSLSEDIALALFEKALLAQYDRLLDIPLYLQKITDTSAIPADCYMLQWQSGHAILRGQIGIPYHIAPTLVDKLTQAFLVLSEPTHSPLAIFAALPMPIRMDLGEMNLSLSLIKDLKTNDLLLPEKSYFTDGTLHLQLSSAIGFTVNLENDTCTVITPLESYRAHMNNSENDFDDDFKKFLEDIPEPSYNTDTSSEESTEEEEDAEDHTSDIDMDLSPANLEDVNIRVTFDVGYLQLTLGELANITPGYIFSLGKSIHKSVNIRANGAIIGKGDLVEIEGTLGISIVELHQRGK